MEEFDANNSRVNRPNGIGPSLTMVAAKAKTAAVPKAAVAFVMGASGVSQTSASEIHQHDSSRLKRSAWAM